MLLRVNDVASRLNLRRATIYRLIRDGILPAVHVGRIVRVPEHALAAFIASGGWRRQPTNEARP